MTMLDQMRRHKGWLKWSLAFVVLTFVVFYIPDFLQPDTTTVGASPRAVIAEVEGHALTAGEFRNRYLDQVRGYREQFGGWWRFADPPAGGKPAAVKAAVGGVLATAGLAPWERVARV